MQAEYEAECYEASASQFTSCPQPLDFPTNPCYSDYMKKTTEMTATELNSIVNDRCQAIEAKYGIECNAMMYEVAVHLNGNNNRATIYSPIQFINWADYALNSPELFA